MAVRQLRLVVVVEEYEAAVAFYRDGLGMAEQEAIAGPGGAHVTILDAGRATLELANPEQRRYIDEVETGREGVAPRMRVALEVADSRAATADAVAAGATELAPPTETPWRSLNARLDAPGDLQITLFQELGVTVRAATDADWPGIWPIVRAVLAAGETYAKPRDLPEDRARAWWLHAGTLVAVDPDGTVVGTAEMHPNHDAAGAHVANAGFMVDAAHAGRGIGRLLAEHVLEQARADGYRAMQFNAVVETNTNAIALWRSLGFTILATIPEAFAHPTAGLVGIHLMHRRL